MLWVFDQLENSALQAPYFPNLSVEIKYNSNDKCKVRLQTCNQVIIAFF